jgi:hypothetical protein
MRLHYTERFRRSYDSAPPSARHAFDRRLAFLIQDLRHPSLRAKKYDEANDIWQTRVNDAWRFYFQIQGFTISPSRGSSPRERDSDSTSISNNCWIASFNTAAMLSAANEKGCKVTF